VSSAEEFLRKKIVEVLKAHCEGLVFDKLREVLEEREGVYVDGVLLRRVVAIMIREGTICKEPSALIKRMLLKLCRAPS